MVRKVASRPVPVAAVADEQLAAARQASEQASARLAAAGRADVTAPGWASEYESASAAARMASRELEQFEAQRAEYLEQARRRAEVAETAAPEIAAMGRDLSASRDKVAKAAAAHLSALTDVVRLAAEHNALLAAHRARLADLGLTADRDYTEGTLGSSGRSAGVRAAGTDFIPVPADGVVFSALRQVFPGVDPRHPFHYMAAYLWMPSQVADRADGLKMPTLAAAEAAAVAIERRTAVKTRTR